MKDRLLYWLCLIGGTLLIIASKRDHKYVLEFLGNMTTAIESQSRG